jgi:hypothetical protein
MLNILIYNKAHYESFENAYGCGGVYETKLTIPSLNCSSSLSDIVHLIDGIALCAGNKGDIIAGVYTNNQFYELPKQEMALCG